MSKLWQKSVPDRKYRQYRDVTDNFKKKKKKIKLKKLSFCHFELLSLVYNNNSCQKV
jgi:hypothetical protein